MKKDRFLSMIQQEACFEKSRANAAWKAAVNIDENDSRWQAVSGEDMHNAINDFAKVFGVELPPMQVRKQRLSHTEQLERQIAKQRANLPNIPAEHLEWAEEDIKRLEKKLQKIREEED